MYKVNSNNFIELVHNYSLVKLQANILNGCNLLAISYCISKMCNQTINFLDNASRMSKFFAITCHAINGESKVD